MLRARWCRMQAPSCGIVTARSCRRGVELLGFLDKMMGPHSLALRQPVRVAWLLFLLLDALAAIGTLEHASICPSAFSAPTALISMPSLAGGLPPSLAPSVCSLEGHPRLTP